MNSPALDLKELSFLESLEGPGLAGESNDKPNQISGSASVHSRLSPSKGRGVRWAISFPKQVGRVFLQGRCGEKDKVPCPRFRGCFLRVGQGVGVVESAERSRS